MIKNNFSNIIFVISSLLVIFFIHPILSIILGILFENLKAGGQIKLDIESNNLKFTKIKDKIKD